MARLSEDDQMELLEQQLRERAKTLSISPVDLVKSFLKALTTLGDQPFAFVAFRRGEDRVDTAAVLARDGKIEIPPGAELITACAKSSEGPRMMDLNALHDEDCPSLATALMTDCRCKPEFRIEELEEQ